MEYKQKYKREKRECDRAAKRHHAADLAQIL